MKRVLKWVGIGICVLVLLFVAGLTTIGGAMVKSAVNTFGPAVMGVPVRLQGASFRPWSGKLSLNTLHVGNPQGFKTPALLDLGEP
jgi:hypothetical protein